MTTTVKIERPTGNITEGTGSSPDTIEYAQISAAYPCRFRSYLPFEQSTEVAGATVTTERTGVRFPVSGDYVPRIGDRLTVITSTDPALAASPARVFRVATVPQNDHSSAYRVYADEDPS